MFYCVCKIINDIIIKSSDYKDKVFLLIELTKIKILGAK